MPERLVLSLIESHEYDGGANLDLAGYRTPLLPPEIASLRCLRSLDLSHNELKTLPPEIGDLEHLEELLLFDNPLEFLPVEIGQLKKLKFIGLDSQALRFPPPEVCDMGTQAIVSFLADQLEGGSPQWISKLILVGEGGVGKSSLLRTLLGLPFEIDLKTTHGIEIVIFKPAWVSERVSQVLESQEVVRRHGIFTRSHMREIWVRGGRSS